MGYNLSKIIKKISMFNRGDKIEVTLDWYEDNYTVELGVLK